MRKSNLCVVILLVAALLVSAALPALRVNAGEKTNQKGALALTDAISLSRYLPADVFAYANMRVDDAYIDMLDGLLKRASDKLPQPAQTTLRSTLEAALKQAGYDYTQDIRSWLGDRLAVGFGPIDVLLDKDPKNDVNVPLVVAIDVTDQAKAESFVDGLLKKGNLSETLPKTAEGAFTVYRSLLPTVPISVAVGKDVLLIGTQTGIQAATGTGARLADDADFKATFGLLTASAYDLLVYANPTPLAALAEKMLPASSPQAAQMQAILAAIGPVAIGGTVLDGRSYVLDVATKRGDLSKLEALGYSVQNPAPIDLGFAANIPANVSLYSQGKDLKSTYDLLMKNLQAALASQQGAGKSMGEGLTNAVAVLKAATGLDLEQDVLSWMTGDYGMFVSYAPAAPGAPSLFRTMIDPQSPASLEGIDVGLVIQAADAGKAKAFADKLGAFVQKALAQAPMTKVSQEQIGSATATVIAISVPRLAAPLELVFGANDKVFVLATRAAATAILSGQPGLDTVPGFAEAKGYLLSNPTALGYMDANVGDLFADFLGFQSVETARVFNNIVSSLQRTPTAQPGAATDPAVLQRELELYERTRVEAKNLLGLLSSGSYSMAQTDKGDILARFVLTLTK
jgi:hypothetical protein